MPDVIKLIYTYTGYITRFCCWVDFIIVKVTILEECWTKLNWLCFCLFLFESRSPSKVSIELSFFFLATSTLPFAFLHIFVRLFNEPIESSIQPHSLVRTTGLDKPGMICQLIESKDIRHMGSFDRMFLILLIRENQHWGTLHVRVVDDFEEFFARFLETIFVCTIQHENQTLKWINQ